MKLLALFIALATVSALVAIPQTIAQEEKTISISTGNVAHATATLVRSDKFPSDKDVLMSGTNYRIKGIESLSGFNATNPRRFAGALIYGMDEKPYQAKIIETKKGAGAYYIIIPTNLQSGEYYMQIDIYDTDYDTLARINYINPVEKLILKIYILQAIQGQSE